MAHIPTGSASAGVTVQDTLNDLKDVDVSSVSDDQTLVYDAGTGLWGPETLAGTGTVTSVAVSGSDGIEVDSGSPITTSGTIALGLNASTLATFLSIDNVENTALSAWAGTTNITTLGTITTGTWNGTAIEGTAIASTGEAGGTKVLTEDGDGTCSWQAPTGSFNDFTLAGDSGSSQTIADGNTLTVAGGTGIDTVASATDTITVNIDSTVALATGDTYTGTHDFSGATITGDISQWNNDSGFITATLTQEQVEDYAGALIATGGTKTLITVTYQDSTGDMDFVVDNDLSNYSNATSAFITASSSDTLTNKTIDGDSNTISNLDIGNEVEWATISDVSDASAFTTGDKVLVFEAGVGMRKVDYDDLPSGGGSGDVTAASTFGTDNAVIRSDGTSKGVQSSGVTINDSGEFTAGTIASSFGNINNGSSTITTTGDITGGGILVTGDASAGDSAAIGYNSTDGIVVTGMGSTSDVALKNVSGSSVISVPTGTTTTSLASDILFTERADHEATAAAGDGILWVKSDTPNTLIFTDDAGTDHDLTASGSGDVSDGDTLSTGLTFPNTGLHILDTNASHDLIIAPGSDLTADRQLTITTGDAARTLTINGDATLPAGTALVSGGDAGTPSALVGTNITGTASGLTAGNVTTNADLTGHITSTGNATVLGSFTVAQLSAALSDASISGNNTGDQTITLTGDVTGSGTGSFATTIAAGSVDLAMLSATGTANAGTFLRGDYQWSAIGEGDISDLGTSVVPFTDLASTSNGEGASLVGIEDSGTLFTATDVEGALAEVKAIADAATGDVSAASTFGNDNVIVRSDGTSKGVQSSGISIDDSDNVTGINIDANGSGNSITNVNVAEIESGSSLLEGRIEIVIDGGGSAITTGIKLDLEVAYSCTIEEVRMLADQSGSIVVDIWKDSYANFPPTDADSITASAVPTISTATKSEDTSLTGWTTSLSAGDILRFNVDSASTVTRLTLILEVVKT